MVVKVVEVVGVVKVVGTGDVSLPFTLRLARGLNACSVSGGKHAKQRLGNLLAARGWIRSGMKTYADSKV